MSLSSASTDYVTIPPGSLYVDFNITFKMAGIDSIDVTTNNYSMSDGIEMPPMELPEMDMSESGISKMEIYRNVLKNEGAAYNENKLIIRDLASSFPFDMNFLLNFQNFSPTPDGDSVKIDTVLKKGLRSIKHLICVDIHYKAQMEIIIMMAGRTVHLQVLTLCLILQSQSKKHPYP